MSLIESSTDSSKPWVEMGAGTTPTSTSLNPGFVELLDPSMRLLDVGSCSGRVGRELAARKIRTMGVDPNYSELRLGASLSANILGASFVQSWGQELPFPRNAFDGAILMAVLGAVDHKTRTDILEETIRCVRPGGLIYVAEFCRIQDPAAKTSDGKLWQDVYVNDYTHTGELGSVRVLNPDGSVRFVGHHFTDNELAGLLDDYGIEPQKIDKVEVVSHHSRKKRDNWNVWGIKK